MWPESWRPQYIHFPFTRQCTPALSITGLEVNFLVHLQSFASKIFFTSKLVRPLANSFLLFGRHAWMILTYKRWVMDIFLTCRLSKSLAFCELRVWISSTGIRPHQLHNKTNSCREFNLPLNLIKFHCHFILFSLHVLNIIQHFRDILIPYFLFFWSSFSLDILK